jgi:hypothetical protein
MFALRDIRYGDELTFDYASGTTNHHEHLNTICLCGKLNQTHHYIKYHNWRQHLKDWELVNLHILANCNENWFTHWRTQAKSLIAAIKQEDTSH